MITVLNLSLTAGFFKSLNTALISDQDVTSCGTIPGIALYPTSNANRTGSGNCEASVVLPTFSLLS